MSSVLPFLLILAMVATVIVLCIGVISFAFNAKINARFATRLMATRVALQFVAIALFGVIVFLKIV
jgi:Hypoxia induced protein conserved region